MAEAEDPRLTSPANGEAVSSQPFVVVLTGGPCAGKSSAMAILRDRLSVRGFQVLSVPENATHFLANSDGFQQEWAGAPSQVIMQRIFVDYQLAQEDAFKAFGALHPRKKAVLLLDCCTLSSKVYLSDEQWREVLTLPGKPVLTEGQLLARYDLVIHMVSCAFSSGYEWGPASNNPGRYHAPEQAKDCDKRCMDVFRSHPQLRVVPPCVSFDDKILKVLHFVDDALNVEGLASKRRRRRVSVVSFEALLAVFAQDDTSSFTITSTFLDDQLRHSVRRRVQVPTSEWFSRFQRLCSRGNPAATQAPIQVASPRLPRLAKELLYERRTLLPSPLNPAQGCLMRHIIHEDEYYTGVSSLASHTAATKHVLSFKVGANYFELFFFSPDAERVILDLDEEASMPEWLEAVGAGVGAEEWSSHPAGSREDLGGLLGVVAATPEKRRIGLLDRKLGRNTTEEAAFDHQASAPLKRLRQTSSPTIAQAVIV